MPLNPCPLKLVAGMDLVAGLIIGLGVVVAISVWILKPDLLEARCPYCNAPVENFAEGSPFRRWRRLEIGKSTFRCTRCLYSHERIWLNRRDPGSSNEANIVH